MGGRGAKGVKGGGAIGGGELTPTEKLADRLKIPGIEMDQAESLGREAAAVINGTRKPSWTVYGTTYWAGPGKYYGGVGYGAGETKYAVNQMKKILRDQGFKVSDHPDGGLMVGIGD